MSYKVLVEFKKVEYVELDSYGNEEQITEMKKQNTSLFVINPKDLTMDSIVKELYPTLNYVTEEEFNKLDKIQRTVKYCVLGNEIRNLSLDKYFPLTIYREKEDTIILVQYKESIYEKFTFNITTTLPLKTENTILTKVEVYNKDILHREIELFTYGIYLKSDNLLTDFVSLSCDLPYFTDKEYILNQGYTILNGKQMNYIEVNVRDSDRTIRYFYENSIQLF